ncbi:hypothetical protein EG68_10875 [Paragonimus skrjabini miyazakii]|uniref:Uncharacterized protein n=1 Tax=Paragonimus skrjabini miyazakii TaxID=59628 RepID=A0A8S9YMP7_9TREM|nr:hypothetical protein EG68_10875 [Paragonimus skrjabini miyazakii]
MITLQTHNENPATLSVFSSNLKPASTSGYGFRDCNNLISCQCLFKCLRRHLIGAAACLVRLTTRACVDCPQTRPRQLSDLVTWRGKRGVNHTPNAIYMISGLWTLFSSRTTWVYCFLATISCQTPSLA